MNLTIFFNTVKTEFSNILEIYLKVKKLKKLRQKGDIIILNLQYVYRPSQKKWHQTDKITIAHSCLLLLWVSEIVAQRHHQYCVISSELVCRFARDNLSYLEIFNFLKLIPIARQKDYYLRVLQQIFFRFSQNPPQWFTKTFISSTNVTQLVSMPFNMQQWDKYLGK